ncbi:tripartite tricarboxylate transporter TctB family protein [Leucobacter luti]|uniref:tripartite tricarboxylate transporter TctB family protein n=1 Tax=Leucobacter luti TaxID=340320 RepID=UPI003D079FE0
MNPTNNPTSASAVVGESLELERGSGAGSVLVPFIMPAVLVAFAGYLQIGILTMRIPEGTAFPGPQFFPQLIAAGLFLFAALLIASAVRGLRRGGDGRGTDPVADPDPDTDPEFELVADEGEDAGFGGAGGAGGADGAPPSRSVALDWRSLAWVVGAFLGFALLLKPLGWIIAAALLFWCVARGFGVGRPVHSLIMGLTVASVAYIAFDMLLGLSLPSGLLGFGWGI